MIGILALLVSSILCFYVAYDTHKEIYDPKTKTLKTESGPALVFIIFICGVSLLLVAIYHSIVFLL